jgi:Rab GDP dissociation inhibitor
MSWRSAFDVEYDAIILGTGFTECVLSGLLAVEGKRILHLDRNSYYGGASASLSISDLHAKLNAGKVDTTRLGNLRDYNVDFAPKFLMAGGQLIKALIHTGVVRYLEFRPVDGSFVYRKGAVHQVPCSSTEAMSSPLMSMVEKARCTMCFRWIDQYTAEDEATWIAGTFTSTKLDLANMTSVEFLDYWCLEEETREFVGHAIALCHSDEQCRRMPADELVMRIKLYKDSLLRFAPPPSSSGGSRGGSSNKSPYLYPLYGNGELPQAFARLAAIYGCTFMLNRYYRPC